ncbi:TIGR02300 family protein [Alphaproteobacteria bacterium]|mgnify:CR=1 FL=1|nr:TIGR02300 family protein [Alphaproteobacteria bacterium]
MYKNSSMSDEQLDLGHKRICPLCSAKYYDFHQDELDCPSCGKTIQAVNINKPKRGRRAGMLNTQTAPVKENDDLKDLIEETPDEDTPATEENLSEDITIDIAANKEPETN